MLTLIASAASSASATTTAAVSATSSAATTGGVESIVMTVVPSVLASALPAAVTTTTPAAQTAPLVIPAGVEVVAIFAGALATSLFAVRKKLDMTGVFALAIVGGLGGGILRDLLLQNQGVFALETPRPLFAALLGGLVGSFFYRAANKMTPAIVVIDAVSLSLFCLVGADKAIRAGLFGLAAIMLGVVTAVGGGLLRDVLTGTVPSVMQRGSLYAVAAISGSTTFVLLVMWLHVTKSWAFVAAVVVAFGLRVGSLLLGWTSPEPLDLTPAVAQVPSAVVSGVRRVPLVGNVVRWTREPATSENETGSSGTATQVEGPDGGADASDDGGTAAGP